MLSNHQDLIWILYYWYLFEEITKLNIITEVTMDFLKLARERYSCRQLSDKKVEKEKLDKIIEQEYLHLQLPMHSHIRSGS